MTLPGASPANAAITSELLNEARDRALRLAVESVGIGIWRYDVLADTMQIDSVVRDIYGMHLDHTVGIQSFRDLIHPQDQERTRTVFDQALVDPKCNDYDLIYRINRRRNGSHVWLQVHARVLWESGRPVEVLGSVLDITTRRSNELMLQEQNRVQTIINSVGEQLSQSLNSASLVELLLTAGMDITGALYGAYFSVVCNEQGEPSWKLEKLQGAAEKSFTRLGNPSATNLFSRSFTTEEVVRSDDILVDPRYGSNGGMPKGHLMVRSYLAVPVVGRNGHHGALLFGHNKPAMFTRTMEAMVVGVAHHAALAFDNAQLFRAAQDEITERKAAEERQQWLMGELNHRVKNILSVIQSIATQTVRTSEDLEGFKNSFINRLHGLSKSHELLTRADWSGADIKELLQLETALFVEGAQRIKLHGPTAIIKPKAVVSLGMAIHELCTNATKYGALSSSTGTVDVRWYVQDERLYLHWIERGGPRVQVPSHKGFGSLLIHRVLTADMDGVVDMMYEPTGLVCHMDLDLR